MARDVFSDTTVARYYNATFLSYKVNLDEGAGKELGTRYGIIFLPTYLYFDSKGKLLHRNGGGKSAAEFIQDGKDAFDPSKAFLPCGSDIRLATERLLSCTPLARPPAWRRNQTCTTK